MALGRIPNLLQTLAVVPVLQTLTRRLNNRARQRRFANQCRAATGGGDFPRRTTHVDVQTVEAELADDVRDLVEQLRRLAINLSGNRALNFRVGKILEHQLRRIDRRLNIDELGQHHIGTAVLRGNKPKRRVSDTVHRCKANDGFGNVLPKIHERSIKIAFVTRAIKCA